MGSRLQIFLPSAVLTQKVEGGFYGISETVYDHIGGDLRGGDHEDGDSAADC